MVEDELSVGDQESNGHSDRAPALLYGEKRDFQKDNYF